MFYFIYRKNKRFSIQVSYNSFFFRHNSPLLYKDSIKMFINFSIFNFLFSLQYCNNHLIPKNICFFKKIGKANTRLAPATQSFFGKI